MLSASKAKSQKAKTAGELKGFTGQRKADRLAGQLLGITQRSVSVEYDHSKERYSRRKLIPVNVKTLGDHLLLKRIEANLIQPELAVKVRVSVRTIKAWEHSQIVPTNAEW